jgi:hypothetical protein
VARPSRPGGINPRTFRPDPLGAHLPTFEEVEAEKRAITLESEEGFFTTIEGLIGTQSIRALLAGDTKNAWENNPWFELTRLLLPKETENRILGEEMPGITFSDIRRTWHGKINDAFGLQKPDPADEGFFTGLIDFIGNVGTDVLTYLAPYAKGGQLIGKAATGGLVKGVESGKRALFTFGLPFGFQDHVVRFPLKRFELPVARMLETASDFFHTNRVFAPIGRAFSRRRPTVRGVENREFIESATVAMEEATNMVAGFYNLALKNLAYKYADVMDDPHLSRVLWFGLELGVREADEVMDIVRVLDGTTLNHARARLLRDRALKRDGGSGALSSLEDRMLQPLPLDKKDAAKVVDDIKSAVDDWRLTTDGGALPAGVVSRFSDEKPLARLIADGIDTPRAPRPRTAGEALGEDLPIDRLVDEARAQVSAENRAILSGIDSADFAKVKGAIEETRNYFTELMDTDALNGLARTAGERFYTPRHVNQKLMDHINNVAARRSDAFKGKKFTEMDMYSVIEHLKKHGDVVTRMLPLKDVQRLDPQEKVWRALSNIFDDEELAIIRKMEGGGEDAFRFFKTNPYDSFHDRLRQSAQKAGMKAFHDAVVADGSPLVAKLKAGDLVGVNAAMRDGKELVLRHRDPENLAFAWYDSAPDTAKILSPTLKAEREAQVLSRQRQIRDLLRNARAPGEGGHKAAADLADRLKLIDDGNPEEIVRTHTGLDQWTTRRAAIVRETADLVELKKRGEAVIPWGDTRRNWAEIKAKSTLELTRQQLQVAVEMEQAAKAALATSKTQGNFRRLENARQSLKRLQSQERAATKALTGRGPGGKVIFLEGDLPGEVAEAAAKIGGRALGGGRATDVIGKRIHDLNNELRYVNEQIGTWKSAIVNETNRIKQISDKLLGGLKNVEKAEISELVNVYLRLHDNGALALTELAQTDPQAFARITKTLEDTDVFVMEKDIYQGIYGDKGVFSRMTDPGEMGKYLGPVLDTPTRWMKTWTVAHPLYIASRVRDWTSTVSMINQGGVSLRHMALAGPEADKLTFMIAKALKTGDLSDLRSITVAGHTGEDILRAGLKGGVLNNHIVYDEVLTTVAEALRKADRGVFSEASSTVGLLGKIAARPFVDPKGTFQWLLDSVNIFKAPSKNTALMSGGNLIEFGDNHAKLLGIIGGLKQGHSLEDSVRTVAKWAYDPRRVDLSNLERFALRPFIPFYSWTKAAVQSQVKAALNHPGNVTIYNKIFEGMHDMAGMSDAEIDVAMPDYLQRSFGVPIKVDPETGQMVTVTMGSLVPLGDVGRFWTAAREALTGDTQAITDQVGERLAMPLRLALESLNERSFFLRQDLTAYEGQRGVFAGETLPKKWIAILHGFRLLHEIERIGWHTSSDINAMLAGGVEEGGTIWDRIMESSLNPMPVKLKKNLNAYRATSGRIRHSDYVEGLYKHHLGNAVSRGDALGGANAAVLRKLIAKNKASRKIIQAFVERLEELA